MHISNIIISNNVVELKIHLAIRRLSCIYQYNMFTCVLSESFNQFKQNNQHKGSGINTKPCQTETQPKGNVSNLMLR